MNGGYMLYKTIVSSILFGSILSLSFQSKAEESFKRKGLALSWSLNASNAFYNSDSITDNKKSFSGLSFESIGVGYFLNLNNFVLLKFEGTDYGLFQSVTSIKHEIISITLRDQIWLNDKFSLEFGAGFGVSGYQDQTKPDYIVTVQGLEETSDPRHNAGLGIYTGVNYFLGHGEYIRKLSALLNAGVTTIFTGDTNIIIPQVGITIQTHFLQ